MNNREIASLFWFLALIAFVVRKNPAIINSFKSVIDILFSKKLLTLFGIIAIYMALATLLLKYLGYWEFSLLKGTVYWIASVGIVSIFKVCEQNQNKSFLKKFILSNIGFIVVIQFLCDEYTFPLWSELLIVPFMAVLAMMGVVAAYKDDTKAVSKVANFILGALGFAILLNAIRGAYHDSENLVSMVNLKSVILPLVYSLAFLPVIYLFAVYTTYENLSVHLSIKHNSEMVRKAMWVIFWKYRLSLKGLAKFQEERLHDLYGCGSYDEIEGVIKLGCTPR
ncbi:MAG: hypothetical protein ABIG61_04315 [Planctomycetota bacterium]